MELFNKRLIPIVVINNAEDAYALATTLVEAGLPIAEVTFRTEAAAESIAIMSEVEGMVVGAGTVLEPAQVELAVEAGAQFLMSPGVRADIIREAQLAGKPIFPGIGTPGEIMAAQALGLDTVAVFPVDLFGGSRAISALSAPFTTTSFIPTGGVKQKNLAEYLTMDCVPAVSGTWMTPQALIDSCAFSGITKLVKEALDAVALIPNNYSRPQG
ncbi:MAG: bifunctional 4-hydroxy-2-oxoglutarate aldolase/2-dehydro-3-deoxy-phosphogluconate aldolase [Propionibacteriaceae bacterium]|jgi:2-dehydro-3-deoxyphosphogluconate aldolase/(4S)-4-hydroxy-2-oxoglutarate aldolase|nr:bifunctional 4-hydroxy-2-oxoglutarate aldolase/2-dehydro-3-deoxy-phosphogluconate aldolase [Propionibacteriaceae bacterium]